MEKYLILFLILVSFLCLKQSNGNVINDLFNTVKIKDASNPVSQLMSASPTTNKRYQECKTPSGTKGHCRQMKHCMMADFKKNIWKVFNYLCIVEKTTIGVCCPFDFGFGDKTSKIVNNLPVIGNEVDNGMDMVVWDQEDDKVNSTDEGVPSNFGQVETIVRPEDRGCGLATRQFPKISGGRPADPGEWPWMAGLLTRGPGKAFCGGALITDRHVLTAAHCSHKYKPQELFIRLGEYDFKRNDETRARDYPVIEIREHEEYDKKTYENDISILKMGRSTTFTSYIWPICMPPLGESWDTYPAMIIGWGSMFFGGPHSHTLMEVSVPIWTQEKCRNSFVHRIPDSVMCAGAYEGGKDSCQGDSGSPLMIQLPNQRWVVAGIVSWGVRCGEPNRPGVYTRVGNYVSWIIENSVF